MDKRMDKGKREGGEVMTRVTLCPCAWMSHLPKDIKEV